jgi:peroxiredoxin
MRKSVYVLGTAAALALSLIGCGAKSAAQIVTHVSGNLSVRTEVDSLADNSGFEVLLASNIDGNLDTLGVTLTDSDGNFSLDVHVDDRGVYPLLISRAGQTLTIEEIVLAAGDSSRVRASFPLDGRGVRIVSPENAAWSAYNNTKAQHAKMVLDLVQSTPDYTEADMGRAVRQTSSIFWGLQDTFPGSFGSLVASAESIVMLEGWADSVAVERARQVADTHPSKVPIARAVRRSVARLSGQNAAVDFVRSLITGTNLEDDAALLSEIVVAYTDSLQSPQAVAAARELQSGYPESPWSRWAEGAIYEAEHLLPGMPAPAFTVIDTEGRVIDNEELRDQFFMLEFYTPTHPLFQQELGLRQAILEALPSEIFEAVSISLEPDSAYNEALLDGRDILGRFVFDTDGVEGLVATAYNVNIVPTRILIDPAGNIVRKYAGATLEELEGDLADILDRLGR